MPVPVPMPVVECNRIVAAAVMVAVVVEYLEVIIFLHPSHTLQIL